MKQHLDEKKVTEWFLVYDIDHGIPLDYFLELAERIYQQGYEEGWTGACHAISNK